LWHVTTYSPAKTTFFDTRSKPNLGNEEAAIWNAGQ
jgi:hypothetical protein